MPIDRTKMKYFPAFAAMRADIARTIRQLRRDRPEMGRLLFLRMRQANRDMAAVTGKMISS